MNAFVHLQIISNDGTRPLPTINRKPTEGQARAKFNFVAQSDIELTLNKGELVALTRRVDPNWFEGRIGSRKGIFPVTYVDVLLVSSSDSQSVVFNYCFFNCNRTLEAMTWRTTF